MSSRPDHSQATRVAIAPQRLPPWLVAVAMAAFLIRLASAFWLKAHPLEGNPDGAFISRDDYQYLLIGREIAASWEGASSGPTAALELHAYYYICAAASFIFGSMDLNILLVSVAAIGGVTVVATYRLAREIAPQNSLRIAALLTAFQPASVFWASVNYRDAHLALLLTVHLTILAKYINGRYHRVPIGLLSLAVTAISVLRPWMGVTTVGATVVVVLIGTGSRRTRNRRLAAALGLVITTVVAVNVFTRDRVTNALDVQTIVLETRSGQGQRGAISSGFEGRPLWFRVVTTPLAMAASFVAPFPFWRVSGVDTVHAINSVCNWFWYPFLGFAFVAWFEELRRRPRLFGALSIVVLMTTAPAAFSSFVGSPRTVAPAVPFLYCLAALGIRNATSKIRVLYWEVTCLSAASGLYLLLAS